MRDVTFQRIALRQVHIVPFRENPSAKSTHKALKIPTVRIKRAGHGLAKTSDQLGGFGQKVCVWCNIVTYPWYPPRLVDYNMKGR